MTTSLEKYQGTAGTLALAPDAWSLAQRMAGTDFVPAKLKGHPEQVLAVILAGHEVGVPPMQALQKIHNIQGKPAMSAELMRAIVLREGHELWIEETTSTRCILVGCRKGSTRETKIAWTLDDAKRAKVDRKDVWQQYPAAMLLARATSALCRAIFPDVLAGITYTVEELEDGDVVDLGIVHEPTTQPAPAAPQPTARARRAATSGPAPAETDAPRRQPAERPEAPLPGEDEDIVDAEIVETVEDISEPDVEGYADRHGHGADNGPHDDEPDEYEGADQRIEGTERSYTPGQIVAMRCQARGLGRDEKLALCAAIVEREITSTKDLTPDEVTVVLEILDNDAAFAAIWPLDGDGVDEQPAEPARRRRAAVPDPVPPPAATETHVSAWTGDQWRALLADRSVKVTELLREAARLAREDGAAAPTTLDEVAGSGFEDLLLGFVEDLSQQRSQG